MKRSVMKLVAGSFVVGVVGCSQLLGLDDLKDLPNANNANDAGGDDGSSSTGDGAGGDGAPPTPGQACVFDQSSFDDGCVFE